MSAVSNEERHVGALWMRHECPVTIIGNWRDLLGLSCMDGS